MVPSSSLASERGGRSCCRPYWKPRRGKEVAWQGPPARASHCLCSSGLGSRWLLGVTNGKYTILSRQSRQKASKDRDAHKDSLPIPLLNYLGKEWEVWAQRGTWEPLRLQEVRVLEREKFPAKKKRESIVFPLLSPWEKKKTSEAQAAVFHWANTRNLV